MSLDDDDDYEQTISIKVRGKAFKTTRSVLERRDSLLSDLSKNMIDHIDRSNTYFEYILKFMEDGTLPSRENGSLPSYDAYNMDDTVPLLLWLKRELHFYAFELPPSSRYMNKNVTIGNDGRLVQFDLPTGVITTLSSEPAPTFGQLSIVRFLDRKFYVFEGVDYRYHDTPFASKLVHRYDPFDDTWETLPIMKNRISTPLSVVVGDYLYIYDGKIRCTSLERYSSRQNTWEPRVSMTTRYMSCSTGALCAVGTDIYLLGGEDQEESDADSDSDQDLEENHHPPPKLSNSYKYDTLQDEWSLIGGNPAPTSLGTRFSTVVVNEMVYLIGNKRTGAFYCFNPRTQIYSELASLSGRSHKTLALHNGKIYAMGDNFTECYDLDTNTWSTLSSIISGVIDFCPLTLNLLHKSPFEYTRLDDLLEEEIKEIEKLELQAISKQKSTQCQMICKSGKRCRNPSVAKGRCHIQGNHGTLCGDEDIGHTMLHLAGGHNFTVDSFALCNLPKRILDGLRLRHGETDLSMLMYLQNLLVNHPVRQLPTFLLIDSSDPFVKLSSRDPVSEQWTTWTPPGLYNPYAVYHSFQGDLYATGREFGRSKMVHRCSSVYGCWTQMPEMSVPRGNHLVVVAGSKMYAIGGDRGNTMETFDGDSWTTPVSLPGEFDDSAYLAACVMDMKIYVFSTLSESIWCYDVKTNEWMIIETENRYKGDLLSAKNMTASFCKDRIYIKSDDHMWTFVPKTSILTRLADDSFTSQCTVLNDTLCSMDSKGSIHVYNPDTMTWEKTIDIPLIVRTPFTTWSPCIDLEDGKRRLESMIVEKIKEEAWEFLGSSPENDHQQN
jgi:N-acetylneuraminic acid mutarotase